MAVSWGQQAERGVQWGASCLQLLRDAACRGDRSVIMRPRMLTRMVACSEADHSCWQQPPGGCWNRPQGHMDVVIDDVAPLRWLRRRESDVGLLRLAGFLICCACSIYI